MENNDSDKVKSVFLAALERPGPERAAYLDAACAGDAELRARVEELIQAHEQMGSFRDEPGSTSVLTADFQPISERPGTTIGRYKLLQEIGEGGMGVVFMAEQVEPVKRRVAVKIIKQGMDTRQFVARFEAERQALAMMDHPNIARVLDAGCTETGRPYFVMELVKGVPITRFCDENRLTARQRLELFVSVCQAVQHAHQKGIIHRDLKPSNVLVALYDDRPVPKIIDFGVAKTTHQQLTAKTLFTQVGQIVGTLEYMSPEQAVLNQLDVDTRTDIYSLGVILYELLTGVTPVESARLRSAALEETLRIIREEEPPKPSTRVSSLGESATATAAYRGTNAASLTKTLRGDLDWIVMKALEKSRSRRYETASGLGADLKRYLDGEAVEARPPSTLYRLRKAASRHRAALVTTAVVALTLVTATVTSSLLWVRERDARQRFQSILGELRDELIDKAILAAWRGDAQAAKHYAERAKDAGASDDWEPFVGGLTHYYRGDMVQALGQFKIAVERAPNSVSALAMQAVASMFGGGRADEYRRLAQALNTHPPREDYGEYDRLFFAYAVLYEDPRESARIAKEALDQRGHWGLGHLIRAEALLHVALDTGDRSDIKDARGEIRKAEAALGDNPVALVTNLCVHAIAIRLAGSGCWQGKRRVAGAGSGGHWRAAACVPRRPRFGSGYSGVGFGPIRGAPSQTGRSFPGKTKVDPRALSVSGDWVIRSSFVL